MPREALVRELGEELGVVVEEMHCAPVAFAERSAEGGADGIVILLYTITRWTGEPEALEGGAVGWFATAEIEALEKPPLDIDLARQLLARA